MNSTKQEIILMETKLHWGLFVPPTLMLLASAGGLAFFLLALTPMFHFIASLGENQIHFPYALAVIILLIPNALVFLLTFLAFRNSHITITNTRLIFKTGVLFRFSGELLLEKIESIFVLQPLFGGFFNYGTVCVRGTGGTPFNFACIPDPQHFHATLQQAIKDQKTPPVRPLSKPPPPQEADDSRYMPKG